MQVRNSGRWERPCARWVNGGMALLMIVFAIGLGLPRQVLASRLPEGVPNLLAPDAAQEWRVVHVGDVRGDPDLPVLLATNTQGEQPAAMLIGLDSRNGTEAYSLESDPVIFFVLLADPETITTVYYDTGFAETEQPSGQFRRIAHPAPRELPDFVQSSVPVEAQARVEGPGLSTQQFTHSTRPRTARAPTGCPDGGDSVGARGRERSAVCRG